MSFATLESAVLQEARVVFNNRKLRKKDIVEWTTGGIEPHDGEVVVRLPDLNIAVAILKEFDKRKSSNG